jgi:hypothetical protein
VATHRPIPPSLLGIAYVGLTIAGLYLFRGVPILNVALGFPIGAWIAAHHQSHPEAETTAPTGSIRPRALRVLLGWSVSLAAVTIAASWIELLVSVISVRFPVYLGTISRWLPLSTYEAPNAFRALIFAIAAAPALQVLTTVFGGILLLALTPEQD